MTPQDISRHAPRALTQSQRNTCFQDGFPWTAAPAPTSHTGEIVRGQAATVAHLDPTPCPVPPGRASIGYGSIFAVQRKGEAN